MSIQALSILALRTLALRILPMSILNLSRQFTGHSQNSSLSQNVQACYCDVRISVHSPDHCPVGVALYRPVGVFDISFVECRE